MRLRQVVKWGNSFVIRLKPSDMKDLGLSEKDEVDIDDIVKYKKKKDEENT